MTHAQLALGVVISIHALVKRATYGAGKVSVGLGDFNPRPREEGDVTHAQLALGVVISIHALVKRATLMREHYDLVDFISIHALVKRATKVNRGQLQHGLFQSTPS